MNAAIVSTPVAHVQPAPVLNKLNEPLSPFVLSLMQASADAAAARRAADRQFTPSEVQEYNDWLDANTDAEEMAARADEAGEELGPIEAFA